MTLLCFNVGNDWNYLSMEWISKFITVYMIRMMHILAYFEPTHPNSMMMLIIFHSSKHILPRWFIAHLKSILPQLRCIQQHDDAMQWKRFAHHWSFLMGISRHRWISFRKGQWWGTLIFSLMLNWTNCWITVSIVDDLGHTDAHVTSL